MVDAVKPIVEDETSGAMDMMGAMMASAADMEEFNSCMESSEPDKVVEDVLEKEMDRMFGDELSDDDRMKMQMEMINLGLKKHCKKQQPIFEGFLNVIMKLQEKMQSMSEEDFMEEIEEIEIPEEVEDGGN
jgi:hypothetical protein